MPAAGRSEQTNLIPAAAAILLLILAAAFRFPCSFYTLLRVTVCLVSLYCASQAHASKRAVWVWCFAASAIVFNPVIPLRMSRSDWRILNVVDATLFFCWSAWSWFESKSAQRARLLSAQQMERVLEDVRKDQEINTKLNAKSTGRPN